MSYFHAILKVTTKSNVVVAGYVVVKSIEEERDVINKADRCGMQAVPLVDEKNIIMDHATYTQVYAVFDTHGA